ncbi:murein hydrolase transporter LrgA [Chitiniphilus shinanonensis]|uniref:Murein hydrolase transporter LrgA n=1 Tax=Chitiniphilus shinanonensis TaxID=553088 RepID=A0ABQ6BXZ5_9NEIS|nr:CidA/LrgA family protein [Chitiniphilus shinanonensis]GLS05092.1 murein hydrolase transporter LrgA [Chitiniphilus shinanonensis]
MLYGLTVICAFLLAGELLSRLAGVPVPGAVLGMLLFTGWTMWRKDIEPRVARVGAGLLRYLPLLFVPAGVGLIELGPRLAQEGVAMIAVLVLSTAITLGVTALTLQWLLRRRSRG